MATDRIKLSVGMGYLQWRRDLGVLLGSVGVCKGSLGDSKVESWTIKHLNNKVRFGKIISKASSGKLVLNN